MSRTVRKRLSNRHGNTSIGLECEGFSYRATAGYFDDGGLAEIFLEVPGKLGTPLQANADGVAILTSLLLQHGVAPDVILHSISGPIAIALRLFMVEGAP
jgi:ribonucleoside-diphosphate reductase alpha chain